VCLASITSHMGHRWLRRAGLSTPASFGLDVPDDAGFARNSPGRSLTLGKTGSLRSHH